MKHFTQYTLYYAAPLFPTDLGAGRPVQRRLGVVGVPLGVGVGGALQQQEAVDVVARLGGHVQGGVAPPIPDVHGGTEVKEVPGEEVGGKTFKERLECQNNRS